MGWDISYCARTKSQSIGNDGEDGRRRGKGSGLGYKRHGSPRCQEGRTAEESTSLRKPPSDTNDQAARGSTQSPLNTPPLGARPFLPTAAPFTSTAKSTSSDRGRHTSQFKHHLGKSTEAQQENPTEQSGRKGLASRAPAGLDSNILL